MNVYHNLSELPDFSNAVLTIGSFDGVHAGHQKILGQVNQLARQINGESIVITFHPHPRIVLQHQNNQLNLLNTIDEKVKLLQHFGIDNVVVVPFTKQFAQQTADDYILHFLKAKFNPAYIVIGYDHKFGQNRQGDINYLRRYEAKGFFKIKEIEQHEIDNLAISSTKIRNALYLGDIKTANRLLNHEYALSGTVVHGQKIGSTLGFPTANLEIQSKHKLIPLEGIYAVHVFHNHQRYQAMLYIGNRPTLEENMTRTIEVNIFDFNKNIYGDQIRLEFVRFIRHDIRFGNLEELRIQLHKDKKEALSILENEPKEIAIFKKKNPDKSPKVAVVILNYNGIQHLKQFLPSVTQDTYPNFEIHIADNHSTDDSITFLKQHYPDLKIHQLDKNYGFAEGYNVALKKIKAAYYVLLNSDVEVNQGWIKPVIDMMELDATIAAAQPKVRAFQNKTHFEHAGAAGGWIDKWGYPFCRGRILNAVERDMGQYDQEEEIFWATGAALFIRSKLYHDIGGFDGDHFAHMEEIDLCWRLKRAGFKIMVQPQSVIYHLGGGTLNYESPNKTYLNFRNSFYMLTKNEAKGKLLWLIPWRLLLDGLAGLLFLFQGKFVHIKAIIKAHWSFFAFYGQLQRKRRLYNELIQKVSISHLPNKKGIYPKSIIWQYYLKGKRSFKSLI